MHAALEIKEAEFQTDQVVGLVENSFTLYSLVWKTKNIFFFEEFRLTLTKTGTKCKNSNIMHWEPCWLIRGVHWSLAVAVIWFLMAHFKKLYRWMVEATYRRWLSWSSQNTCPSILGLPSPSMTIIRWKMNHTQKPGTFQSKGLKRFSSHTVI